MVFGTAQKRGITSSSTASVETFCCRMRSFLDLIVVMTLELGKSQKEYTNKKQYTVTLINLRRQQVVVGIDLYFRQLTLVPPTTLLIASSASPTVPICEILNLHVFSCFFMIVHDCSTFFVDSMVAHCSNLVVWGTFPGPPGAGI